MKKNLFVIAILMVLGSALSARQVADRDLPAQMDPELRLVQDAMDRYSLANNFRNIESSFNAEAKEVKGVNTSELIRKAREEFTQTAARYFKNRYFAQ